ncbi:MAG TPA: hypothetical protein VGC21_09590 [Telluria sp.]|jgi:hypothetical protein
MQIDKLQIELRPRTNSQALDLGYALLRSHAGAAYKAYLALWLPLVALAAALSWFYPLQTWLWVCAIWWLKPLLERAPLYVLSRKVFGTAVTWQEAVRAWPRQLGGGWFRLLTWARPVAHGRSLAQPVWQLENARGAVASARRRVLGRQGTGATAFFFGFICFVIELMLMFGIAALIGLFISDADAINPFILFSNFDAEGDTRLFKLLMLGIYALVTAFMAPIYTACGFTLYLNRRASLEAWDLELQLRQITAPAACRGHTRAGAGTVTLAAMLLAGVLALPPDAGAAPAKPAASARPAAADCIIPEGDGPLVRSAAANNEQARARRDVDALYASREVHGWVCAQSWDLKKFDPAKTSKPPEDVPPIKLDTLAAVLRVLLIAGAIGLVAWLLYRYRDRFSGWNLPQRGLRATEVGGLDIRAESLPDDVTANVRQLWAQGQRRAALALLYRATLSRLVTDDALILTQGNTEGDCLRLAARAAQEARLSAGRLQVARATTTMWLDAAYAGRWLDGALLEQRCTEWDAQFGPVRSGA